MSTFDYMSARLRTTAPSGYLIYEWFELEPAWAEHKLKVDVGMLPFKENYETV